MSERSRYSTDPKDPNYRIVVRANEGAFEGLYEMGHEELTSPKDTAQVLESRCFVMTHEELVWVYEAIGWTLAREYRKQQDEVVRMINEANQAAKGKDTMTIQVQVSNLDQHHDVKVTTMDHDKATGDASIAETCILKPAEARTFWVHLLRDLMVEEVNPTE